MSTAGARSARIDLLRGISILLVLFHHFSLAYRLNSTPLAHIFGWGALHALSRNGNYGVTMFFVISGYLITDHARRRWGALRDVDVAAFWRRRAARILPCLVLLICVVNALGFAGVAIFQSHDDSGALMHFWRADAAALGLWMNVLVVQTGWVNYALCVVWSLSVEEIFYLAFPALCAVFRRQGSLVAVWGAFVLAGPIWRAMHQGDDEAYLYDYLACFDGIAIGCCAAVLAPRVALPGWAQGGVALAMTGFYLARSISVTNVYGVTLMAIGTAVLIVSGGGAKPRALAWLRWCGRLSYEFYLFHLVVLGGLRSIWPPEDLSGQAAMAILGAYLLLSAAVAWVIARGFSAPLNARLRRRAGTGGPAFEAPGVNSSKGFG